MGRTSSKAVMRLGPLALRLLARRRRWLRWAAIGFAVLTLLSAVGQIRHRPVPRRSGVSGTTRVQPAAPPRNIGVADIVPRDMRAVNLIVPEAATFGGRLAPGSRVDVLAAFDMGQDRAVRQVVASGLVLHVARQAAPAAASFSRLSGSEGRLGVAAVDEVALAVPAAREREIVMAQAFGRVFLAIEPTNTPPSPSPNAGRLRSDTHTVSSAGGTTLLLRHYVGLPAATTSSSGQPGWAGALAGPPPLLGWPVAPRANPATPAALLGGSTRSSNALPGAQRGDMAVELIEGTARTIVEVSP
ncbi:MAG TPA: RcpC/CpaB family pilus assembly protein [bacterium]|nr:RcpC/CpaB family pilus assembly protein [bacterium]